MKIAKNIIAAALAALCSAVVVPPALAEDYDLVILNGRVMDPESKLDAVRNVGVKDGKIAEITENTISGKEAIDATGHVVAPGFIDTDMTRDLPLANIKSIIPMARVGSPEEVARVVRFLCSDDASYVCGQVVEVNGGMH